MPTLPKQERPAREGARVASVETGLAAAAAKLAQQVRTEEESVVASVITVKSVEANSAEKHGSTFTKCWFSFDPGAAEARQTEIH